MISRIPLFALSLVLPLAQAATWAGCYSPSALGSLAGDSTSDLSSSGDCIAYCTTNNSTISFFSEPTASTNSSCICSTSSPPPSTLRPASGPSTCSPDQATGTYLVPSFQFESCSYAASTTAQYIYTSNSSTTCFEECGDYPVTYIFPSAGGYNCYCAMTSNGAGKTSCGDNTFYAYSRALESSRSRR